MRDRQVFKKTILPNDIAVYEYPTDDPYVIFSVTIPVGHVHNVSPFPCGMAHFYEHMVFHRSILYPEKGAFSKWVVGVGGNINAHTKAFKTTYVLQIPNEHAEIAWRGFYSLIFEPIFTSEDIDTERVIINGEKQLNHWYPGDNRISSHLWTNWMSGNGTTRRQLYGNPGDLDQVTTDALQLFQKSYIQPGIFVVVAGGYSGQFDMRRLAELIIAPQPLAENYQNIRWKKPDFHTFTSRDVEAPVYFMGSIYPLPGNQERVCIVFLLELLTNDVDGVLFNWLREELGWTYGAEYSRTINRHDEVTVLEIPLQTHEQVDAVRRELDTRVRKAVSDVDLLTKAVTRQLGQMTFHYQTLKSIVVDATHDIHHYGEPLSEGGYRELLQLCLNPAYVINIYEKFFSPKVRGEIAVLSDCK